MVKSALSVLVMFLLAACIGCSGKNASNTNLKIKGFYVGMPAQEFMDLVNTKYHSEFYAGSSFQNPTCYMENNESGKIVGPICPFDLGLIKGADSGTLAIVDKANGAVTSFTLPSRAVNALFNVSVLKDEDFVQHIVDNYKIPEMTAGSEKGYLGMARSEYLLWEYTSPEGYNLKIYGDGYLNDNTSSLMGHRKKEIVVTQVASQASRKFN